MSSLDAVQATPPEPSPVVESPVITSEEFRQIARISEAKWYSLKRAGLFRGLESPIPNRWSRAKVIQWLEGR